MMRSIAFYVNKKKDKNYLAAISRNVKNLFLTLIQQVQDNLSQTVR